MQSLPVKKTVFPTIFNRTSLSYFLVIALLAVFGFTQGWNYSLSIALMCLISALMTLGVNIQWGYAGLFNAGVMGFAALGGIVAVLLSHEPVIEAWSASQPWIWSFLFSILVSVLLGYAVLRLMPKSRARYWTITAVSIVGFLVSRWLYFQATPLIEAVNPAGTGFLGGLGVYDWAIFKMLPGWKIGGSFIVFLLGGGVAAAAAYVIGRLTLGLKSDYLAIATLGISEVIVFFLKNEEWLTRGVKNVVTLPRPLDQPVDLIRTDGFQSLVGGWFGPNYSEEQLRSAASLVVKLEYAGLFVVVIVAIFVLAQRALNSPWGRMMRAIRDNEVSAEAMGKDIVGRRLTVFVLGSAVVGVAGAMLTTLAGQFTPNEYVPLRFTFLIWVMVILGGTGNNFGSILGAFVVWMAWVQAEPFGNWLMNTLVYAGSSGEYRWFIGGNADLAQHLIEVAPQMRLMLMGIVLLMVLRYSPAGVLPERVPGRA